MEGPKFTLEQFFLIFPDITQYKSCNGSCFMYLSEILSKLQMCKITNFMMFSDGLLICVLFAYKPHKYFFYPCHNH